MIVEYKILHIYLYKDVFNELGHWDEIIRIFRSGNILRMLIYYYVWNVEYQ